MKKFLFFMFCLLIAARAFAGVELKVSPVYGILIKPDLSDIDDIMGSSTDKGGVGVSAQWLFDVTILKIGAEFTYFPLFDIEFDDSLFGTPISVEFKAKIMPILGVVNFELPVEGGIKPYLQGGIGLGIVNTDLEISPNICLSKSETQTGFSFMVGGGALVELVPALALDVSVKYYRIGVDIEIMGDDKSVSALTLGAGASLRF